MSDYPHVPQQISDPISENLAKLAELFPAAVKDGALDLEALRAELGEFEEVKPGDETYELSWVGKQSAKKESFKPLLGKTLALKDDGKNSDTTQNLYIEGDNLEALKLLRQNYYGEVKMIYIDPPYNTGRDFVYTDKFAIKTDETEEEEGAVTAAGQRLIKNEKTSNRFHARWLDMIYPRLKLAKDLLREDGVIFISIDDSEAANLKLLCDEVFGEINFVANGIWSRKRGKDNSAKFLSRNHEYFIVYARSIDSLTFGRLKISDETRKAYRNTDNDSRGDYRLQGIWARGTQGGSKFAFESITGSKFSERLWLVGEQTMKELDRDKRLTFIGDKVYKKLFLSEHRGDIPETIWLDASNAANAADEIKEIFGSQVFDTVKPVPYIVKMLLLGTGDDNEIILDFFSGSATTAHAVLQLNAEDGGNRRFIMVQLPEVCDDKSEAAKAGFKTIAEIGKERIRRAGDRIKQDLQVKHAYWKIEQAAKASNGGELALNKDDEDVDAPNPYILDPDSLDIGFKSFRIEDTKINWLKKDLRGEDIIAEAGLTTQDALDFVPGYTDTDVVYELMLRQSNIPLTGTITHPIATAKRTYLYADAYLICLEEKITQKLVEALAAIEPTPNKYFFRDSAFGKDIALKDETFRRLKAEIHKHHGDLGTAYTVEFI